MVGLLLKVLLLGLIALILSFLQSSFHPHVDPFTLFRLTA